MRGNGVSADVYARARAACEDTRAAVAASRALLEASRKAIARSGLLIEQCVGLRHGARNDVEPRPGAAFLPR